LPQDQSVEIVVSDTGIGIAPEELERIFEKFYRVGDVLLHSTGRTKFKGAGPGLGLTIARGIVEAHGGRIWAESPGYDEETCPGGEFHIVLPVQPRASLFEEEQVVFLTG
jgi:signal transduction histidine kinase